MKIELVESLLPRPCGGGTLTKSHNMRCEGLITSPIKSGRINTWPSDELDLLDQAVIAGYSKEKLKMIVRLLEAERGSLETESHPEVTKLRAMICAARARAEIRPCRESLPGS